MTAESKTDYLVIGSGAVGMAFTDVLLTETDSNIVIVDRDHQPGGHWNHAYPFVRLHQPSAFYGVNSVPLGSDSVDEVGWNQGLYELATSGEICAYFDHVMQRKFLPSGRVRYFPMCDYLGDGKLRSRLTGDEHLIDAAKVVNATYSNVILPAMRKPPYEVEDGATCVPPNAIARASGSHDRYVIVGAGKTAMDVCLFLLKNQVDPNRITWIMPRDSWLLDRANLQPKLFGTSASKGFALQLEAMASAESSEDLLLRLADCGQLLRFDENVWPTMYRCAIVTRTELKHLQSIPNIVRMGRVRRIGMESITLDDGSIETTSKTMHIDCTADGLQRRPAKSVFDGSEIALQPVRTCQQVFSAAFIAHIEANYQDEAAKNELCTPVPLPDSDTDFVRTSLLNCINALRWSREPNLNSWLENARLDGYHEPFGRSGPTEEQLAIIQIISENLEPAIENLRRLQAALDVTP